MTFTLGQQATFTKPISGADVAQFAEITGDSNPLHVDEEFASRSRFGGRIAHGILTAGLISTVIGMQLPGPGGIYVSQTLNFLKPVRIGDTITAAAEVLSYDAARRRLRLKTTCVNQRDELVLDGEAVVIVDPVGR